MCKICYLLESTALCGGVKVVFRQAEALIKRGHHITIISAEDYPEWFEGNVIFKKHDPFDVFMTDSFEWIIATTPRLVVHHYRYNKYRKKLVQLIQGYEPDLEECRAFKDIIDTAYSLQIQRITISTRMAENFSEQYPGLLFTSVGQGLESEYFYPRFDIENIFSTEIDRIFLIGPMPISFKRIDCGLSAIRLVKENYPEIRMVRISAVDTQYEENRYCQAEEYFVQKKSEIFFDLEMVFSFLHPIPVKALGFRP